MTGEQVEGEYNAKREMENSTSRSQETLVSGHLLRDKTTAEKREDGGNILLFSCLRCLLVA